MTRTGRKPTGAWTCEETAQADDCSLPSLAWPGLTLLTRANVKTAAWLMENKLAELERTIFIKDLKTKYVTSEVQIFLRT